MCVYFLHVSVFACVHVSVCVWGEGKGWWYSMCVHVSVCVPVCVWTCVFQGVCVCGRELWPCVWACMSVCVPNRQ